MSKVKAELDLYEMGSRPGKRRFYTKVFINGKLFKGYLEED
jgi:hypothetical protein